MRSSAWARGHVRSCAVSTGTSRCPGSLRSVSTRGSSGRRSGPGPVPRTVQALHRLWVGAIASGLVRVSSTKAVGVVGLPPDDEGRLSVGLRALVGLMQLVLDSPYHAVPIVFALLTSYVDKRRLVTWDEIVTFHRTWRRSPKEQAELEDLEDREWFDNVRPERRSRRAGPDGGHRSVHRVG